MIEGRLPIYKAADKILDFLTENRAVDENRRLTRQEVLVATSLDEDLFEAAYDHLRKSGYLMALRSDEGMWMTTKRMKDDFSERTRDFLDGFDTSLESWGRSLPQPNPISVPSTNIINIYGTMNNSPIQQETTDSSQTGSFASTSIDELRCLLNKLQASLSELGLRDDNRQEAEATIVAVDTQLGSPLPDQGLIKKSLESMKRIIESAAGSAIGSALVLEIAQFIAYMDAA